jgi:hypothetical protein
VRLRPHQQLRHDLSAKRRIFRSGSLNRNARREEIIGCRRLSANRERRRANRPKNFIAI